MKVIDFTTRKVIANEPRRSAPSSVPVITLNKGKFTLAVEQGEDEKFLVIYNTASKVEIARRPVRSKDRNKWISWAVEVVDNWQ